jgi:hypothetical protein
VDGYVETYRPPHALDFPQTFVEVSIEEMTGGGRL